MLHTDIANAVEDLRLGATVTHLSDAAAHSQATLTAARKWLREQVPLARGSALDVVVLGSFARLEATGESDFDYLVVAHSLPTDVHVMREMLRAVDHFIESKLTADQDGRDRRPGRTGLFGHIASAPGLTERIGLEQDTNVSTTRRLLILEESASIYQPDRHTQLLRVILERYLADYDDHRKPGVPRFLLNDVARYWYTLAVDYQAKRWEADGRGWGLRYLKFLISRKITYAGTITSLLLCDERQPATVDHLLREFEKPPLARLAQLSRYPGFDQHEALSAVITIADEFVGMMADPNLRGKAKEVASLAHFTDPILAEVRQLADRLHLALGELLFASILGDRARRYLAL